jgi:hypothetical protein
VVNTRGCCPPHLGSNSSCDTLTPLWADFLCEEPYQVDGARSLGDFDGFDGHLTKI